MIDLLIHLFAFFVTVPLLATLIAFVIFKRKYPRTNIAFQKAAQWTAVFYVIAVDLILTDLFQMNMLLLIVPFFVLIVGLLLLGQYNTKGHFIFGRAIKTAWRLFFLIFFVLYILLAVLLMIINTLSVVF